MQTNYSYSITRDNIVLVKGGKRLIANASNANFPKIIERIKNKQWNNIERLFSIKATIEKCFNVEIRNGKDITYKGKVLNNELSKQIIDFVKLGYPYRPLVKFLNKVMENPSEVSRESIYKYLSQQYLPVTEDGDFIACKTIRHDWMDFHSGKVSNKVGEIVFMDRKKVSSNPKECAGAGLHVGSTAYIRSYNVSSPRRFIMVKVNPRDVVVVPEEGQYQKIRLCRYKVIDEIKEEDLDFKSCYAPANNQYSKIRETRQKIKRNKNGQFAKQS